MVATTLHPVHEEVAMPGPDNPVEAYLEAQPEHIRVALEKVRATIRRLVPDADEVISYQVPTFRYHGPLVAYGATKNHCSLYVMSPGLMAKLTTDLGGYEVRGATIHFPAEKPLPAAVIRKVVNARIEENVNRRRTPRA
jgi:uncharacterized protein YdhG (YjbR/CyaY superfamily)